MVYPGPTELRLVDALGLECINRIGARAKHQIKFLLGRIDGDTSSDFRSSPHAREMGRHAVRRFCRHSYAEGCEAADRLCSGGDAGLHRKLLRRANARIYDS